MLSISLYIHSAHIYRLAKGSQLTWKLCSVASTSRTCKGVWVLSGVLPAQRQIYVSNCGCSLEGLASAYVGHLLPTGELLDGQVSSPAG